MKVGDLVKVLGSPGGVGIIVAEVDESRATGNDVFKVLWTDGSVTEKIWDYNLFKVEA